MAYSRVKVWIAAEVLTASDLNNEHNGHITNENDLDTRLISEISSRSTLETEYDAFYAVCWNAGSSEIAANKVSKTSMKDDAIGLNEIEAAATDPAADVGGLRTLGTTSVQAAAGTDSRFETVPNDYVHLGKIKDGSVMLPFCDSDTGTEFDNYTDAWTTVIGNFRVYIPSDATSIRMASRQKGPNGYLRFFVGSIYSNNSIVAGSAYEWKVSAILNVSALAGWYNMGIQLHKTGANHSYLQGFSFVWV